MYAWCLNTQTAEVAGFCVQGQSGIYDDNPPQGTKSWGCLPNLLCSWPWVFLPWALQGKQVKKQNQQNVNHIYSSFHPIVFPFAFGNTDDYRDRAPVKASVYSGRTKDEAWYCQRFYCCVRAKCQSCDWQQVPGPVMPWTVTVTTCWEWWEKTWPMGCVSRKCLQV